MTTRPDPDQLLKDAAKLKTDRFQKRDAKIKQRNRERFNQTGYMQDVPIAYRKDSHEHRSQIIEDEGRNIGTLVHAQPVSHIPPPKPEDQPQTTACEQFLDALLDEAQTQNGPVWWQDTLAQIHDNIGWLYWGWKKVPYKGQPQAPADDAELADVLEYGLKNEQFKRDAGVQAFLDLRYVPTGTAYHVGNIYNPDRFYEIKDVPERDLMDAYGITKNKDGTYSARTETPSTVPSGYSPNKKSTETLVQVVEYWDRDWCMIIAREQKPAIFGRGGREQAFVLQEWQHGWGRVPYFSRPAFVTEQLDEDKKFAGPLDGVYTEMPEHKVLRTMGHAVAYQTAFSPLQVLSEKDTMPILDDNKNAMAFIALEPGKARQLAPGQKITTIPQSPEVANLFQEIAASQARIEHFSLSPAAKGISPGADTANAALSNLHRFQLSILDPMAEEAARQWNAMARFALERIQDSGERYYVFDDNTDSYLSLAASDIVSVNVQGKVTPDQGQFQLLIEKHAAELHQRGLITLQEMYEMWGKENPEQYVLELKAERLADSLEPVINQQIVSDLGMLDATQQMIAENAKSGSARNAVPGLMDKIRQMNPTTGAGKGSGGLPRGNGVRSPVVSTTTQPQQTAGGGY